jgi:hypothetical protein
MPLLTYGLIKYSPNTYQRLRSYVSATYANTVNLPSRIRYKQDTVYLQMLTTSKLGNNLQGNPTLREFIFGSAWHTLLKIDNKKQGIFYEKTYINLQTEASKTNYIPPENIIFPENIFGVPQVIWDSFINHLDHQEVVALLGLKRHRHLWPAYHYALAAPTPELIAARAKHIGQFHFLLNTVLYQPEDIERQQVTRPKELQFSILKEIKKDLDDGKFDTRKMEKFHACLSVLLVHKLQHCSNIFDLSLFAALVSNYAKMSLEPIDIKRKHGAISLLPYSGTEPERFFSVLKLAKTMNKISARPGLLFFNSHTQWRGFGDEETDLEKLGKHYFDALFHDLILRQTMLQAHAAYIFIDDDLLQIIKERFESLFLQKTSINKIKLLQTYWQHNSHHVAAYKNSKNTRKFWSPLISNIEINGIKMSSLASVDSIIRHGRTMEHCVQEPIFVASCRNLSIDIVELVSADGEKSTLDIRPDYPSGYYILQHVGVGGDDEPSKKHVDAGIQLIKEMKAGRIQVSKARQMELDENNSSNIYQFEYDLDDINTQDRIYQVYKSKKMLPPRLIFANYLEMLEHTDLVNIIDDVLKRAVKLEPSACNLTSQTVIQSRDDILKSCR